jgi:hypothetical protein
LVKIASLGTQILDMETMFFPVPAGFLDLVAANKNVGGLDGAVSRSADQSFCVLLRLLRFN